MSEGENFGEKFLSRLILDKDFVKVNYEDIRFFGPALFQTENGEINNFDISKLVDEIDQSFPPQEREFEIVFKQAQ